MNSFIHFGDRWWQVTLLALLGVGLLTVQGWPSGDGVPWLVAFTSAVLIYPLLAKSAALLVRIPRLPEAWRTAITTVVSIAGTFAAVDGVRALSWHVGTLRFLDMLPVAVGAAIGAAFGSKRHPAPTANARRMPVSELLIFVVGLGIGFGYLAGTTDAQEQLAGSTWVWQRAILVACFTWMTVGGLLFLGRRSRPAA
jgi:hypothetical protein